jgi:hypothetical protein
MPNPFYVFEQNLLGGAITEFVVRLSPWPAIPSLSGFKSAVIFPSGSH